MVGDHLALDILNTEAHDQDRLVDYWATSEDLYRWLHRHGITPTAAGQDLPAGLLPRGRELRAAVREAVHARKAGQPIPVDALNLFLQAFLTSPSLQPDEGGILALARVPRGDAISSLLGPVAEAAAQLLVEGDFTLVRQCEHSDCVLWFYDRTKSHKRRWCSMARCGNRSKAARHRKRNSLERTGKS